MSAVPAAAPVITPPPLLALAILLLLLLHVPPPVAFASNIDEPTQTAAVPVIAEGMGLTTAIAVA